MDDLDELRRLQAAAIEVLDRNVALLDGDRDALLAANGALREEMIRVVVAHQRFKHCTIYDPALASGDKHRAMLARHMKASCVAAGMLFDTHRRRWDDAAIAAEWETYRVAAYLTANQLRRFITTEAEGIEELMAAYA